jgi:hypothetical protein
MKNPGGYLIACAHIFIFFAITFLLQFYMGAKIHLVWTWIVAALVVGYLEFKSR